MNKQKRSNRAARRYFLRVRRVLSCAKGDRKDLLSRAGALISSYAEEYPQADYAQYVSAFGPPREFAQSVSGRPARAPSFFRRLALASLAVAAVALIGVGAYWCGQYLVTSKLVRELTVIEYPPQEITEEEFWAAWNAAPDSAHSSLGGS